MKNTWTSAILAAACALPLCARADESGAAIDADGPVKLSDPEQVRTSIPALAGQRVWTDYATAAEIALFDGPEHPWRAEVDEPNDFEGFDQAILGSKVPPVGVHPRVLFSPEDIPAIKERLQRTNAGRRALIESKFLLEHTLWDPTSDEGKIFAKLSTDDLGGLTWPETESSVIEPKLHYFEGFTKRNTSSSHNGYLPALFQAAAMYCLLEQDDDKGTAVATAIYNYWKLREPLIDLRNQHFDASRQWPNDLWRGMHNQVANNNLGFNYDLAAPWMTEEQKVLMRRVIRKATKGKRAYGQNGPIRWRVTNWTAWDLEHFLVTMSIEGEDGYDPDIYPSSVDTVRALLKWEINENGTIYETNGKNGAGLHMLFHSMVAMARRGDNFFGHPHLRRLPAAQAQTVIPTGQLSLNNGTWGCDLFGNHNAAFLKNAYPKDKTIDYLLSLTAAEQHAFDADRYADTFAEGNSKKDVYKIFPLSACALGPTVFTCADWAGAGSRPYTRSDLGLPHTFSDSVHGLLATRSDDTEQALMMLFEARNDLNSIGHQKFDAGHFYLAALGHMWAIETGHRGHRKARHHNTVLIDGIGYADYLEAAAPRVEYYGASTGDLGAIASASLKHAYDYAWTTPMHFSWNEMGLDQGDRQLSVETTPDIVDYFRGTQHYKMRIWAHSYWEYNWGPTMRVAGDPVEYAYRSAGMIRGEHPYAVIVDDIRRDGQLRTYEWLMQLPDSVRIAQPKYRNSTWPREVILIRTTGDTLPLVDELDRVNATDVLPKGTKCLIVRLLIPEDAQQYDPRHNPQVKLEQVAEHFSLNAADTMSQNRLNISVRGDQARYRVLLIPHLWGDEMPATLHDTTRNTYSLSWGDQKDGLTFAVGSDQRTSLTVDRQGRQLQTVKKP